MRLLLLVIGALATYEIVAQVASYNRRYANDIPEDARLNRVRILNQTGQLPGEMEY